MGLYLHFRNETCFIIWLSAHLHIYGIFLSIIIHYYYTTRCIYTWSLRNRRYTHVKYLVLVKIFVLFFNISEQTQTIFAQKYQYSPHELLLNSWPFRLALRASIWQHIIIYRHDFWPLSALSAVSENFEGWV